MSLKILSGKVVVCCFVLFFINASQLLAAPLVNSITGDISNGGQVELTGTNFGPAPNVYFYTDFEQGVSGSVVKTGAGSAELGEISSVNSTASLYTNSASVSGNLSFQTNMSSSGRGHVAVNLPAGVRDVFISWYLYLPAGNNYPGEGGAESINWKQMWILGSDTGTDDLVVPTLLGYANGTGLNWVINGNEPDPGYANYTNTNFAKGQWSRFAVWLKGGYSNDGQLQFWTTDSTHGTVRQENDNGVNTLKNGGSRQQVIFNAYGRTADNSHPTFDDPYIAIGPNARARIEIGDSSTYDSCTKFAVGIPTNWGASTITATLWTGAFQTGQDAYLYVIDADGNVSNSGQGFQVTIGDSGGSIPTDQPPTVSFSEPTTGSRYSVEATSNPEVVNLQGTANDDKAILSVNYATDKGDTGTATTTDGFSTWSVPITVNKNETVVTTITVTDDAGQQTSKTMTITCTCPVAWDATAQTGDATWSDSSVTYCVRLLVEGDSITGSAGQVVLGFKGRSSGDYTIRNVSIAQRDSAGNEGDVIDSTWQQVTFDNAAWNTNVTVGAGAEKYSDPVTFSLQPGTDYYVTFKIDAPSVYLDPPAGYRELYFDGADHTSDVDWSGNGYSTTQDYHALSKICIYSSATSGGGGTLPDTTPPAPPSGLGVH